MNTLSATELRKNIFELLNLVMYKGEEFLIKKDGKPVARLVPVVGDKPSEVEIKKTFSELRSHFSKYKKSDFGRIFHTPEWKKKDKAYLKHLEEKMNS